jgi:type II secretory pathway component GspD/PulD (secretin)
MPSFIVLGLVLMLLSALSWAQPDAGQAPPKVQENPLIIDTLEIKDMDINDALKLLAMKSGLNIIAGRNITGRVSIFLQNVEVHDALTTILKSNDLAYVESHGVLQIMTSEEYEQMMGHRFGMDIENTVLSLKSVKASQVVGILSQVKSQKGKIIADDQSNSIIVEDIPEKIVEIKNYISQIDAPSQTEVFRISYAKADELAKTVGPMLTKDVGSLQFDNRSNTMVVKDVPTKIQEIGRTIYALDKDDKEVFIEAKIVQITLNDNYQMGINWETLIPAAAHAALNLQGSFSLPSSITTGLGTATIGTLSRDNYNVVLQALDAYGKSRTLSNPHLAVINNQEASILIGTTIPYTTSTTTTPAAGSPTTAESVNFIDTGVKLHVTPTIHTDGYVTMKIKPEISNEESTPFSAPDGSLIPIIDTSEVQTTVSVKDGVTIIIGGLIKDQRINNKSKIPVLGDLPILGKVFSNENRELQKTEIVIFLTPHIIKGDVPADAAQYIKDSPAAKAEKTYYNPLPKTKSTVPVP